MLAERKGGARKPDGAHAVRRRRPQPRSQRRERDERARERSVCICLPGKYRDSSTKEKDGQERGEECREENERAGILEAEQR